MWSELNKVLGQETNIEIEIENRGILTAEDVSASLYESEWYWNGTDGVYNLTLIKTENLPNIDPDERIRVNLTYTPNKLKDNDLRIILNASNEGNFENNDIYHGFDVVAKSMINNTFDSELSGRLLMKMQVYNSTLGDYEDVETVVDEQTIIPGNDYLALDTLWLDRGGYTLSQNQDHRVYAALLDGNNQVISNLEDSYYFWVND